MSKEETIQKLELFLKYYKDKDVSDNQIIEVEKAIGQLEILNIMPFKHSNESLRELVKDWYNSDNRKSSTLLSKAIIEAKKLYDIKFN